VSPVCIFDHEAGAAVCRQCGRRVVTKSKKITAACRASSRYQAAHAAILAGRDPRAVGLGDWVARGLEAVGITKARVSRWLGRDCGCGRRQAALNLAGDRLSAAIRATGRRLGIWA